MSTSRNIARVVGPALVALGITEPINIGVFAGNAPAVVYLNGALLFIAGVAIVQAHFRLTPDWTVLLAILGWVLVAGGLYRMIAPAAPQIAPGLAADGVFAVLVAAGAFLTYKGYAAVPRNTA